MPGFSNIHLSASSTKKFLAPEGGLGGGGEQGKPKPSDESEFLDASSEAAGQITEENQKNKDQS